MNRTLPSHMAMFTPPGWRLLKTQAYGLLRIAGAAVGAVVGIPLVFLVGRHLPRDVARRRAYVLGAVLPPLTLFVGTAVLFDDLLVSPGAEWLWYLLPLSGAALLGSRLAGWLAGMDDDAARPVS